MAERREEEARQQCGYDEYDDELDHPPLRKPTASQDHMWPFSQTFSKSCIPEGVKQQALPPLATIVDLNFPEMEPAPGLFRERTAHVMQHETAGPSYLNDAAPHGQEEASSCLRSGDVHFDVGFQTVRMPGYDSLPAGESLDKCYEPCMRLGDDTR